ncbi:MAG: hypothetical protein QNK11_00770 [Legionella sp.]|nr:hypothetical protein [Legionella sp.]
MPQYFPSVETKRTDDEENQLQIVVTCPTVSCPTEAPACPPMPNCDSVTSRLRFYCNATQYVAGTIPTALITISIGALFGFVFGMNYAEETGPCNREKNDHLVEQCARSSNSAGDGALYGALTGFGFSLLFSGGRVASTPLQNTDELSFGSGLEESCTVLGGLLQSCSNR